MRRGLITGTWNPNRGPCSGSIQDLQPQGSSILNHQPAGFGNNFLDSKGILMVDYMPQKTTITGEYYANLMRKLCEFVKQNRRKKINDNTWNHAASRQLPSAQVRTRFLDDECLKDSTEKWLEEQSEEFYYSGIVSSKEKWSMCIEVLRHHTLEY